MHAEECLVDERGERQLVERVHDLVVELQIILVHALVLEVEERCELAALVVASEHEQRLGVCQLEGVQVQNDLAREAAAVDIVAEEEVLSVLRIAADLE